MTEMMLQSIAEAKQRTFPEGCDDDNTNAPDEDRVARIRLEVLEVRFWRVFLLFWSLVSQLTVVVLTGP